MAGSEEAGAPGKHGSNASPQFIVAATETLLTSAFGVQVVGYPTSRPRLPAHQQTPGATAQKPKLPEPWGFEERGVVLMPHVEVASPWQAATKRAVASHSAG